MDRIGTAKRKSKETDIKIEINIDGSGKNNIDTGIGFFDHMLTAFSVHGGLDLNIKCNGDLEVDGHHTVEDVAIVLGKAIANALGNRQGITRFSSFYIPMDEALAFVCLDISGRPFLHYEAPAMVPMIGKYDSQLTEEFLRALASHAGITLHARILYGTNAHHMVEALFKALAKALKQAVVKTDAIVSTKGMLD